ncbi:MAG: hypothetical protein KGH61_04580 [Candidatus Micrarchaeota archaeon]|nr:hypothetical protein [Candidatus Micrarchaeota archaeon]MDE1848193.1 hypothetical protein [Candidatus Micrarchaeota archaeon]MDE1864841.1 hypothetical protein [Candidatus Micrarchaeota archaeon]
MEEVRKKLGGKKEPKPFFSAESLVDEIKRLDSKPMRHVIILANVLYAANLGIRATPSLSKEEIIKKAAEYGIRVGIDHKYERTQELGLKVQSAGEILFTSDVLAMDAINGYIEARAQLSPFEDEKSRLRNDYTHALGEFVNLIRLGSWKGEARTDDKSPLYRALQQEVTDKDQMTMIALTTSLLSYYYVRRLADKTLPNSQYLHPDAKVALSVSVVEDFARGVDGSYDASRLLDNQSLKYSAMLIKESEAEADALFSMIETTDFTVESNRKAYQTLKNLVKSC